MEQLLNNIIDKAAELRDIQNNPDPSTNEFTNIINWCQLFKATITPDSEVPVTEFNEILYLLHKRDHELTYKFDANDALFLINKDMSLNQNIINQLFKSKDMPEEPQFEIDYGE